VPDIFLIVFGAGLGLILGSFGTALAYRVPRGESIAEGRSRCPNCGRTIPAIENIPVFSYLFLRGRCAGCGVRISPRYPLIESATGLLFVLTFLKFDFTLEAFVYSLFFWVLVVLSVIDIETKRLPDVITGPSLVVGWIGLVAICILRGSFGSFRSILEIAAPIAAVAIALVSYDLPRGKRGEADIVAGEAETSPSETGSSEPEAAARPTARRRIRPLGVLLLVLWLLLFISAFFEGTKFFLSGAAVGAAIFAGFFFSMVVLYEKGMGLGDAKLGLLLGSFTGFLGSPDLVVAGLFFAFVLGGIGGAIQIAMGGSRKDTIPFGPFLAAGATISIFVGDEVVDAYSSLIGG
jgi:prepilin signal peptidase PulO-like enzyme (type II secretory pathway)